MAKKKTTTSKQGKTHPSQIPAHIPVVGIGASAGGLDAFKQFFEAMPSNTGMAFVLVQHLDPTHKSLMVDLLSRQTKMKVVQIEDQMGVKANQVYMIPPNRDLSIRNGELYLSEPIQRRGLRLPIDFFFTSLAEDQRERSICIILSGTGSDGTLGLKAIKSYGGMVMAQTPKTAQHEGMPVSAISTGAVDYVLPVADMPGTLIKYVQHAYVRGRFGTDQLNNYGGQDMNTILAIMHAQLGHNFHYYKKNTLFRRVQRRMGLKQFEEMGEYIVYLRSNPDETMELFKDMLIGVTGFFRDKETWQILEDAVISPLVKKRESDTPLRIWVPGCASGEEAYSMAILLIENYEKWHKRADFHIFATDIDTCALEYARHGRYPESIATDLSAARLKAFFVKKDGFYRVSPKVRDHIVFSVQNLITDPPFSKLDIISCRNLLIYLEADIQSKIIELFHFALRGNGYLMLGNSETIGQHQDIFTTISKKFRLFRCIDSANRQWATFPILPSKRLDRFNRPGFEQMRKPIQVSELVNQTLLKQYAPTSVLINRKHEILYHFGNTVDYLRYPTGQPSNDLYTVAREGLITRLRGAINKSMKTSQDVVVTGVSVKRGDKYHPVKFSVNSLSKSEGGEALLLVSFEDAPPKNGKTSNRPPTAEEESIVKQLEYELSATKQDLQNTIEELESYNEELKASNEEIMSMNEELQSSNEELESSKEELQSLNEELNTVNNELQDKVGILKTTNNDLLNLINSTNMATVFLNTRSQIKFFSPAAKDLFNLIATDIGRSLEDITTKFYDPELHYDSQVVLDTLQDKKKEVQNDMGRWFIRKIQPYRTSDNRIEGIVLTFEEITWLKKRATQIEEQTRELQQKNELLLNIFSSIYTMTVLLDFNFNILQANDLFMKTHRLHPNHMIGQNYFSLFPQLKEKKSIFQRVKKTGEAHFILAEDSPAGAWREDSRLYDWVVKPIKNEQGQTMEILLSIVDVTERERAITRKKSVQVENTL